MDCKPVDGNLVINGIDEFDLYNTFDCGQCFRWNAIDYNTFEGVAFGKYLKISKVSEGIILFDTTKEEFEGIWRKYFDFDRNYKEIRDEIKELDGTMREICKSFLGIRILCQDPWETLCSFIISQNNNIPRIRGIISRLCENFGEKIQEGIYSFPEAEVLADLDESDLEIIRSGFRSKYILDAAKKVSSGEVKLENVKNLDLSSARDELMKIKGVGPKVADCTLLYGFHRLEVFPIDVWIKRSMEELFSGFSPYDFGRYAGIAQQYIFHYSRTHQNIFKK